MYSTELIRKFPEQPDQPILYVVYDEQHIRDAEALISVIHGEEYLKQHVTITTFAKPFAKSRDYAVYIDPLVYKYKHSWNN